MDWLHQGLDFALHLSDRLDSLAGEHPAGVLGVLFTVVFCETGLVLTPFLPGDSLLFAIGAVAARGRLNPVIAGATLLAAAFCGDNVNYWLGRLAGRECVRRFPRFIPQARIDRTHAFFERHGRRTIILARFVPIVRTFAPFVAGMGAMPYARFLIASLGATLLWVGLLLPAGWLFGNLEPVRRHFELVVLAIIALSLTPVAFEAWRSRGNRARF